MSAVANIGDIADVVVVGAGTAGCAAAVAAAAAGARVVVVDAGAAVPAHRVGESLPGAATPLLRDLGIEDLQAAGHDPCHVRYSRWGSDVIGAVDAVFDPDGPGWTLDRARFEGQLRDRARALGARMHFGRTVVDHERVGRSWRLRLRDDDELQARALVVATGRSPAGRWRADRSPPGDRQLCYWAVLDGSGGHSAPGSYVESCPDGWWYTTPLPRSRRMLAFHTDPDLGRRLDASTRLLELAHERDGLRAHLRRSRLIGTPRVARAGSRSLRGRLLPAIPVGDAAMTFDPIAGQGLFNALCTGMAGGNAATALLGGDTAALDAHADSLDRVWRVFEQRRDAVYRAERRWPEAPYWRRRQA